MIYVRTENGIVKSYQAMYETTKDVVCRGSGNKLTKGSLVVISKEWWNYYGKWVDLIDIRGRHYSVSPCEVPNFTKEIRSAETIEELCDCFVDHDCEYDTFVVIGDDIRRHNHEIYGAIWTERGLIYVAKMNEKGRLELL